jgi:hypothetical protein
MFIPDYNLIPSELIGELSPLLTTSVQEIINARIDQSQTGTTYLVIPFNVPNNQYAILVEISEERLTALKTRSMKLIFPFVHPEKKVFFLAELDENSQIIKLAYLFPEQRKFDWPIADNLDFDFSFTEKPLLFSLLNYSKERNRCAIEIIFESKDLRDNMRIWSFRNVLLPFAEMVKTAILSNNLYVNANNLETKLKFGFTKIEHKCLRSILEFDVNSSLAEDNLILENIQNMYLMLDADQEELMKEQIKYFSNKKIVPDMIKIFRAVMNNKGILKSQMATPDEEFKAIVLNRSNSEKRKSWLDKSTSGKPYTITVTGYLTRLDFEKQKAPLFTLHPSNDDKMCGKIASDLVQKMDETHYNFRNTEYKCELEVIYTPQSAVSDERYDYTLLDISDAEIETQTEIIPEE